MMADILLQCYNKGCGQKFDPGENTKDSCKYHPGVPVFHDALKGWSCCKKRSTDFTEFLNIPGCTVNLHSNDKPPEPEKPPEKTTVEEIIPPKEVIVKPPVKLERPSEDEPLKRLKATVASTLKQALEKHFKELSIDTKEPGDVKSGVKPGDPCHNASCKAEYVDEGSNDDTCTYHPGVPIFHEGLKFWTCCMRKTSDFDAFLNQEGCETGKHQWVKQESEEKKVACRMDWHQTGTHVTLSIFSKVALPEKSFVDVNKVSAKLSIVFEGGKSHFKKNLKLFGVIDPERSNVKMMGTKVEVNLRKMEPCAWKSLELPENK